MDRSETFGEQSMGIGPQSNRAGILNFYSTEYLGVLLVKTINRYSSLGSQWIDLRLLVNNLWA